MSENITINPSQNKPQKPILSLAITIIAVIILAVASIYYYNNWSISKNTDKSGNQAVFSRADINSDFENSATPKTKLDIVPPQAIIDRFQPVISVSLEAIKSGKPSRPEFDDLREDYLNVAHLTNVLGDYATAEKYYLEALGKYPKDYKFNMNLGDLYQMMGRYKDAANKFYDVVELAPTDELNWSKLADLYAKYSLHPDRADLVYSAGIEKIKGKVLLSAYAAYLENDKKDYNKAIEIWREYEKVAGSKEQQEIERLQKMIN